MRSSPLVPSFLCSPLASQQAEPPHGGLLQASIYLPGACLVMAVPSAVSPASAASSAASPLKPKYFAVEVQGSSSQLLASVGPRMGRQRAQVSLAAGADVASKKALWGAGPGVKQCMQPGSYSLGSVFCDGSSNYV